MPAFNEAKRFYGGNRATIGQQVKNMSDWVMEETWDNNIESKRCYIYDYYHDEHPELNTNIPHDKFTKKTPIDAKFIITKYWTISSDQPEYHIEFKPSQKLNFREGDDLYYFETDYRKKYGIQFPVGMYIDIPNEQGVYERWLIYGLNGGNQFLKYTILKCDYYLHWIEFVGDKRYKRKMWCVLRSQNSYNSGLWTNYTSTLVENQNKLAIPLNDISEYLYYVNASDKKNQRLVVSAPTEHPLVWQISKVENLDPMGIQIITIYQDQWNADTDYIDKDEQEAGDLFAMYANYNVYTVEPDYEEPTEIEDYSPLRLELSCNTNTIKAGGSYKLLTAKLYNKDDEDVTDTMEDATWTCAVDDEDWTENDLITWKEQPTPDKMRIKFGSDRSHYTEILTVNCTTVINNHEISGSIQLEIIAL